MAKRKTRTRPTSQDPARQESAGPAAHEKLEDAPFAEPPEAPECQKKSRSQKKRESTFLQGRGEKLAALSPTLLAQLPLTEDLAEALAFWSTLKTREAKRRHLQYIGRLMREMDNQEELVSALESLVSCRVARH